MNNMNKRDHVNDLYVKNDTLSTRLGLHDKYSANAYGFYNWIFDQFAFSEGFRVLELGCGTGRIWANRRLPKDMKVTLTDVSDLMLSKAKSALNGNPGFEFRKADIQRICFPDACFDAVIANHMLYHVPDLDSGLSEAARVLAPGGRFYATTNGENTLLELQQIYKSFEGRGTFTYAKDVPFTLRNGRAVLKRHFRHVELREYIDALRVTDVNDLFEYVKSYNQIPEEIEDAFRAELENRFDENGVFHITKEQGIFICSQAID